MKYFLGSLLLFAHILSSAQIDFKEYGLRYLDRYAELLSMPNDAYHPEDLEVNIQWCEKTFADLGFATERLSTSAAPLLLAECKTSAANAKTVLVYLQLDGQPVDPSYWYQEDPYKATLKRQAAEGGWEKIPWSSLQGEIDEDWRIFSRSASDSKGPVSQFLTALEILKDQGQETPYHLKVIMDFEEELGSPNLPEAVDVYKNKLAADMFVIFDGPMHASGEPTLTFGARGIATIQLEVYGPLFPQHSGHYGNYVPNPAVRLSQLIASMKDKDGRVTIPGWYDGITITPEVQQILSVIPDYEPEINLSKGIAAGDKVAPSYQQSLQYPSLNVRGMQSGWVREESRTIIPATAIAEIDIRLVLESDPERLIQLFREHVEAQGFYISDGKPTSQERNTYSRICSMVSEISYKAFRTEFETPIGAWLVRAMQDAHGKDPIMIRTAGGSIPISPFVIKLEVPAVGVPTVNRDNNQHSPNENLRLGNYLDGIKTMYQILTTKP